MPEALEELLRAGDYDAVLERLLEGYETKIYRLAVAMLRDGGRAEEVTQDVFLKVWRALPRFDGRAALSTWLYTIARNTCLSVRRAESYRQTLPLDDSVGADLNRTPSDLALHQSVARLPDVQRAVITLFYFEDRSVRDVAAALDMSEGTVKSHLHRARRALGEMLE